MYLERFRLDGKVAVVTGGARGIGLATVEALAEAGASVVIADMNGGAAAKSASALGAKGYAVGSEQFDVTDPRAVERAHAAIVKRHGRVDILVNNAGIAISPSPAESTSDDVWLKVIDVNLNGVFWCCRTFGIGMIAQGGGSIVNIGSISGFIVNRPQAQAQYNASKAAVHHLTKSLAVEWAPHKIRVNSVAPTYIESDMTKYVMANPEFMKFSVGGTPMNRMGQDFEIASCVLFLAGEGSSLLTGTVITADGGYTCW